MFRLSFATLVASLSLVISSATSHAAFQVQIFVDGALQGTLVDGDNDGQIVFTESGGPFTVDGFKVFLESAFTNQPGLPQTQAQLTNLIRVAREFDATSNLVTRTLDIIASVTDFNFPLGGPNYEVDSELGGTSSNPNTTPPNPLAPGTSVSFTSWFDDDNNPANGFGTALPTVSTGSGIPGSFNESSEGVVAGSVPFALVNRTRIVLNADGQFVEATGQTLATATDRPVDVPGIPEPASMVLFGLGGIGLLGGAVRRRRGDKAAA